MSSLWLDSVWNVEIRKESHISLPNSFEASDYKGKNHRFFLRIKNNYPKRLHTKEKNEKIDRMNNAKYRTPIQNDRCEQRKRKKIPDNIDQNE